MLVLLFLILGFLIGYLILLIKSIVFDDGANGNLNFSYLTTSDIARHCEDVRMIEIGDNQYIIKLWFDTGQVGFVSYNFSSEFTVHIEQDVSDAKIYNHSEGNRTLHDIKRKFKALNNLNGLSKPKKIEKEEVNPTVVKELPSPDIVDLLETLEEAKLRNDIPEIERVERSLNVRGYVSK